MYLSHAGGPIMGFSFCEAYPPIWMVVIMTPIC